MNDIIARGAEAVIYLEGNNVVKERISKGYRLKELDDQIRKLRTRHEGKLLAKAGNLAPKLIKVDEDNFRIEIEYVDGDVLAKILDKLENKKEIMRKLGEMTAELHDSDVMHGDLTTSNVVYKEGRLYIIDFGLGFVSKRFEDRAVDIHLLKQALEGRHFRFTKELYECFLEGYKKSKDYKETIDRLTKVEKRGRYKAVNN